MISTERQKRKWGRLRPAMLAGVALAGLTSSQALAEPATEQGAKAIKDGFARYFGTKLLDKGIITIKPNGDAYDVTYDFSSAKYGMPADGPQLQFGPFTIRLTPQGTGKFAFEQATSSLDFVYKSGKAGPQTEATQRLKNCSMTGMFDASAATFVEQKGGCESGTITFRTPIEDVDATVGKLDFAIAAKTQGEGATGLTGIVDILDLVETVTVKDPANPAPPMAIRADRVHENFAVDGFASAKVMDAFAFYAGRKTGDAGKAGQDQARAKLKAILPLYQTMTAQIRYENMSVGTPGGIIRMAAFDSNLASNGLVKAGTIAGSVAMSGLALPDGMVPEWARGLVPEKATVNLNLAGLDLDAIASKAIEASTDAKPVQPGAFKAMLMPLLLAGQPKLTFDQSLTAPAYDVKGQGETSLLPSQQGKATISASNLDDIAAALGKAGASGVGPQRAAMGLAFLKGLAKKGPDGRLIWDVDFDSLARKVTVNGQSFGPGAQK